MKTNRRKETLEAKLKSGYPWAIAEAKEELRSFAKMMKEEAPENWGCYSIEEIMEMAEDGELDGELEAWLED